jgi:hypothetical protein
MKVRYGPKLSYKSNLLDRGLALHKFKSAIEEGVDLSFDLRLKKKFVPPSRLDSSEIPEEQNVSVLALAYPQIESNKVVGIMGCKCLWAILQASYVRH